MGDIAIYAAILLSGITGICLGIYFAFFHTSKKQEKEAKTEDKPKETTEDKTACTAAKQKEETISLKDEIASRKGTSLTSFECDDDEEESEEIAKHQKESNQAYEYLAKKL